ncbi:hypothetical protein EPO34_02660 [Patescibacteria group bacterium]|nr:MAG: hypothetical protein EPO34_02660 [Patescibacteria group bacterium]
MKTIEELEAELDQQLALRLEIEARIAKSRDELKVTDKMIRAVQEALGYLRGEPGQPLAKRILALLIKAPRHRMRIVDLAEQLSNSRNTVAVCIYRHRFTARLEVDGELWCFGLTNPQKGMVMAEKTDVDEEKALARYAKHLHHLAVADRKAAEKQTEDSSPTRGGKSGKKKTK